MSMHPGGGPTRGPARFLSDGDGDGGWDDSMGERLLSALDAFLSSPSNLLAPPVPVIFAPLRLASALVCPAHLLGPLRTAPQLQVVRGLRKLEDLMGPSVS